MGLFRAATLLLWAQNMFGGGARLGVKGLFEVEWRVIRQNWARNERALYDSYRELADSEGLNRVCAQKKKDQLSPPVDRRAPLDMGGKRGVGKYVVAAEEGLKESKMGTLGDIR